MFWVSVLINIIVQLVFHPTISGGNNSVSFASAIAGRAFAFLLLPFLALGIMNLITYFTKKPIKHKTPVLWLSWLDFFVVSTLSYLS